jgi:Uri superfamily endonuclease
LDQAAGWTTDATILPAAPGAYAVWIELAAPAPLPARLGADPLPPGHYCYLGNAWGPGGIRARCRRHLAPRARHWHVDWLTARAASLWVKAFPESGECDLIARLLEKPGLTVPRPGFGSSDCRRCPAHLLACATSLSRVELGAYLEHTF